MSMAPTTAPNVFWTASPTFLAIRVPPSSSKAASSNSSTRQTHTCSGKNLITTDVIRLKGLDLLTSWDPPVVETRVTDSDGIEAPAPLWDRPGFGGAGIAETFSAGATVVLGVIGLEFLAAFMTFLWQVDKTFENIPSFWLYKPHSSCSFIITLSTHRIKLFQTEYQDERVGSPVGGSDLVRQPGGDCFGRFDAEFRYGLRNVFDAIQQSLSRIVVVFQKAVRLEKNQTTKTIHN